MSQTRCLTRRGKPLHLQSVYAQGRIAGRLLEMTVEQRYRNPEPVNVEIIYTFPLPWQAILLGLEVELNGERLVGVIRSREQARTQYEDALADGDTGVLVTVNPDETYTLELGNLMAGEECIVRLRYAQVLTYEQGSLRLIIPTTIAPRYGDPQRGGYAPHAVPQVDLEASYPFRIEIAIEGELAGATISSPSHPIALRRLPAPEETGGESVRVTLGRQSWLDRDFVLILGDLPQQDLAVAAPDLLDPGKLAIMASLVPALPDFDPLPVSLKVLIDCSGSMGGDSIEAARRAMLRILDDLKPGDRLSLSRFGNIVEHRFKTLTKVTPITLASARRWVEEMDADMGGTEMHAAILSTLALPETGDRRADILLITDGEIYAIDEVVEAARRAKQRFFTVGIGAAVSEVLLRRLAEVSGGCCEFVAPGEAVEPAVLRLFKRMRAPTIVETRLAWPEGCAVLNASDPPKTLFAGDDLVLNARLQPADREAPLGPIELYGRLADEPAERLLARAQPRLIADDSNTLARIAIDRYCRGQRLGYTAPSADSPVEAREACRTLAERYQLLTADTGMVLVKERTPQERARSLPEQRKVGQMLAVGWGGSGSALGLMSAKSPRFDAPPPAARAMAGTFELLLSSPPVSDRRRGAASKVIWSGESGLTPQAFIDWLQLNPNAWPQSYQALRAIGLPVAVIEWLEFVIGAQDKEPEVVAAFIQAMIELGIAWGTLPAHTAPARDSNPSLDGLLARLRAALSQAKPKHWPPEILGLTESEEDLA